MYLKIWGPSGGKSPGKFFLVLRTRTTFSHSQFRDWTKRMQYGLEAPARAFEFDCESVENIVVAETSVVNNYNGEGLDRTYILRFPLF